MKLSPLIHHDMPNQEEIIKEIELVISTFKGVSASFTYHRDYIGTKNKYLSRRQLLHHCLDNQIPFRVLYYGVSKIVRNKNEFLYSFYWTEDNRMIIDYYKKTRKTNDTDSYIDNSEYTKEQIKIKNLLASV